MREEWKIIPDYEKYEASELGQIRNKRTKKIKTLVRSGNGYIHINLYRGNELHQELVHRLIAKTFLPNPNNYKEVNHKDGNITNNKVENLEWCDRTYNIWNSRLKGEIEI